MEKLSSYGVFESVLKDANKRFRPSYVPDEERLDILRDYCQEIDRVFEENRGSFFEAIVNESTMRIHMSFDINEFVEMEPEKSLLQQLIERSCAFSTEWVNDGAVRLHFVFPSVWRHA